MGCTRLTMTCLEQETMKLKLSSTLLVLIYVGSHVMFFWQSGTTNAVDQNCFEKLHKIIRKTLVMEKWSCGLKRDRVMCDTFRGYCFFFHALCKSGIQKFYEQTQTILISQHPAFLSAYFYLKARSSAKIAKNGHVKPKSASDRGTTGKSAFCSLLSKQLFECLKKDASQRTVFIIQTERSKGVQKNMLKARIFNKNKLRHKCIYHNLQKILRTNILYNATGHDFWYFF